MYRIVTQFTTHGIYVPSKALISKWAKKALKNHINQAEVTIRIVTVEEMLALNSLYRKKNKPTNVLSFPFVIPKDINFDIPVLGDIVICAEVVNNEALEQSKTKDEHWAHMIVHGLFHLLGHDHETEKEAKIMEALEIETLKQLGFANPYRENTTIL